MAVTGTDAPAPLVGPVRVADAIRWLELGDVRGRPSWDPWIAGPVEEVTTALGSSLVG